MKIVRECLIYYQPRKYIKIVNFNEKLRSEQQTFALLTRCARFSWRRLARTPLSRHSTVNADIVSGRSFAFTVCATFLKLIGME